MNTFILIGILFFLAISISHIYYIMKINKIEIDKKLKSIENDQFVLNKNQFRIQKDLNSLYKFTKGIEKPILNQIGKLKRSVSQIQKTK